MINVLKQDPAKRLVQSLLLVVIILYIITGFGITEYRTVGFLTLVLLTKPLAFKIHDNLIIPFIVLLGLHIYQRTNKASEV
jgi:predicted transporter